MRFHATIECEPRGQGRPRSALIYSDDTIRAALRPHWAKDLWAAVKAVRRALKGSVRVHEDPPDTRCKEHYRLRLLLARNRAGIRCAKVPLDVTIVAVWPSLKSAKAGAPPEVKATKPDVDNVTKAILDAANGVLWTDDAQVVSLHAHKLRARKGEKARIHLAVRPSRHAQEIEDLWRDLVAI